MLGNNGIWHDSDKLKGEFREAVQKGKFTEVKKLVCEDSNVINVTFSEGNIFDFLAQNMIILGVYNDCDHASIILFLLEKGLQALDPEKYNNECKWAFLQLSNVSHAACTMLLTGQETFPAQFHNHPGLTTDYEDRSGTKYTPENVEKTLADYKTKYKAMNQEQSPQQDMDDLVKVELGCLN